MAKPNSSSEAPSKRSPVRVAVVGLGFMGVTHLRVYRRLRNVRIVAVGGRGRLPVNGRLGGVSGNIQQPEAIELGPQVKVYADYAALLADPAVDVVDLCTPTAQHPAQVVAALRAGKHVLCEKPLVHTPADARRVLAAAAAAKTFLMPAMCMRFWPGWSWLKGMVAKKQFGRVLTAGFRRVSVKPAWGAAGSHPGGALLDLHIHDTDFVNFLFGRPAAVFATGVTNAAGVVDHVVTQYLYPGGPAVQAEGGWLLPAGFNMGFEIVCERAAVSFDLARGAAALQITEAGKKTRTVRLPATDGYAEEIRYFIDCVAQNRRPELAGVADGVTALAICRAEEQSIRTGRIVKL